MNKLARDIEGGEDGGPDGVLDRAIMAIAVTEDRPAKEIIADTRKSSMPSQNLNERANLRTTANPMNPRHVHVGGPWLSMVLTGPVPITNAVTEFSFKLFWDIFPNAVVLVAIGLFIFHSDLLQAGITGMRPLQGFKVVVIAGLPTLCAVFWTLGLIGATNYEVTMTVIIVGPILLALGVSTAFTSPIGMRKRREQGREDASILDIDRTCSVSLRRDDRHRFHLVGLHAHGAHPNRGHCPLSGYRHCVLPHHVHGANLTLILDLKKPKHPPLKAFDVLVMFLSSAIGRPRCVRADDSLSATIGQANVEENIDLLGMAPETESPVVKMKQYSSEFEAGQVGMILVNANVSGDFNDAEQSNDDPVEILQKIDNLERKLNTVENTTAVSVVFLMKSSGVQVTVSAKTSTNFCSWFHVRQSTV